MADADWAPLAAAAEFVIDWVAALQQDATMMCGFKGSMQLTSSSLALMNLPGLLSLGGIFSAIQATIPSLIDNSRVGRLAKLSLRLSCH